MSREIRFNAFDMNCVAHQSPGLWRHPLDQSWRYKELGYWTDLETVGTRPVRRFVRRRCVRHLHTRSPSRRE